MAEVRLVRPTSMKQTVYVKKTASVAFPFRGLVTGAETDGGVAGVFIAATSSTERVYGATQSVTVATDADYAQTTRKPILVDPFGEWEMAVGTGTADTTDPGGYVDLKDTDELDVTASTIDAFFVSRFISATKLRGYIVRWQYNEAPATN